MASEVQRVVKIFLIVIVVSAIEASMAKFQFQWAVWVGFGLWDAGGV